MTGVPGAAARRRRDGGPGPALLEGAALLLVLGFLLRLLLAGFVIDLAPEAVQAYQLGRSGALDAQQLLRHGGLPLALRLAQAGVGPVRAWQVNAPILVAVAALVWACARRLAALPAPAGPGAPGRDPAPRAAGPVALCAWLLATSAGSTRLLELANPVPGPLGAALWLGALWLLLRCRAWGRRAGAVLLGLGAALALWEWASSGGAPLAGAPPGGLGRAGAVPLFQAASQAAPLLGAAAARALRGLLARLPAASRALAGAGAAAVAWLVCLLCIADAGARGWIAPGERGRDSERLRLADVERLREQLEAPLPARAQLVATAPLADLLRVFLDAPVLRLDPSRAAGAEGAALIAEVDALLHAGQTSVFACTGAAGASRDPAEQLLAGDFDLAPVADLSAVELRLGRFLAGRERLELAQVRPWSQERSEARVTLERAGESFLSVDVGRLSRLPRRAARLWLDGRELGAARRDFANYFLVPSLAPGSHELVLVSDAPVPRRLAALLRPAAEGLQLAPEEPEQRLTLRSRLEGGPGPAGAFRVALQLPTPEPRRAAFLVELGLAVHAGADQAARQRLELRLGDRLLASGPLGPAQDGADHGLSYGLGFGVDGAELRGDDAPLAISLAPPAGAGPAAPFALSRAVVHRVALREPFELPLGRGDGPFLISGFGGKVDVARLRARSVRSRAELYALAPRQGRAAWLEVDYVERAGAGSPPRFAWDGLALAPGRREFQRSETDGGHAVRLVRERLPLAPAQLAGAIHRLAIQVEAPPAGAEAPETALLLHRVRVAGEPSALDAPPAAGQD